MYGDKGFITRVKQERMIYRPIESVFSQGQSGSDSDAHQICQLVQSCEGMSQNHVEHPCLQQDPRSQHQFHEMSYEQKKKKKQSEGDLTWCTYE